MAGQLAHITIHLEIHTHTRIIVQLSFANFNERGNSMIRTYVTRFSVYSDMLEFPHQYEGWKEWLYINSTMVSKLYLQSFIAFNLLTLFNVFYALGMNY